MRKLTRGFAVVGFTAAALLPAGGVHANGFSAKDLAPTTMSRACELDGRFRAACNVVGRFFRDVNSGRFGAACALLGSELRAETGGTQCRRYLAVAIPEPVRWGILGASVESERVSVLVRLARPELDHTRVVRYSAVIGHEGKGLRILQTLQR